MGAVLHPVPRALAGAEGCRGVDGSTGVVRIEGRLKTIAQTLLAGKGLTGPDQRVTQPQQAPLARQLRDGQSRTDLERLLPPLRGRCVGAVPLGPMGRLQARSLRGGGVGERPALDEVVCPLVHVHRLGARHPGVQAAPLQDGKVGQDRLAYERVGEPERSSVGDQQARRHGCVEGVGRRGWIGALRL